MRLACIYKWTSIALLTVCIVGCGYQLRSWRQWPIQLESLQLKTDNLPFDALSSLQLFLKSMHVKLQDSAPYTLSVTNYQYSQTQPTSSNSSVPSTITFSISMDISIVNKNGFICVSPFTVSSSFSELEPASTMVVRSTDPDIKQRLIENTNESIFATLTSHDVLNALKAPQCIGNKMHKK